MITIMLGKFAGCRNLSIFGKSMMAFVSHLIDKARSRLVQVEEHAAIADVASLLHAGTDIVVICNAEGRLVGIITKTDLVERLEEPMRVRTE
jgi:CBS-domain-containing membrane protein